MPLLIQDSEEEHDPIVVPPMGGQMDGIMAAVTGRGLFMGGHQIQPPIDAGMRGRSRQLYDPYNQH